MQRLLFLLLLIFSPGFAGDVLFLLEKGFNRQEFYDLYLPLVALGYEVDIASTEVGTVFLRKDGTPDKKGRDVRANLAMRNVKEIGPYRALVIPGGYSPGFLENDADALRLAAAFAADPSKPTAAICHGPRLLMDAGILEDRVWTGLHNIASEKPTSWVRKGQGTYVDQQVVKDGDLLTSRYPQDTPVLADHLIRELASRGGTPRPEKTGTFALVLPERFDRHIRWSLTSSLKTLGFDLIPVSSFEQMERKGHDTINGMIRFRSAEEGKPELPPARAGARRRPGSLGSFPILDLELPEGEFMYPALLPEILEFAVAFGTDPVPVEAETPEVAIVLAGGADEQVVLAMQTYFEAQGMAVVLTGLETGWIKGLGGFPLQVEVPLEELGEVKTVVAPGGLWPEKLEKVRQGESADWMEEQRKKDQARQEWILSRLDAGSDVILVGLDALRIGRLPRFKGSSFSSTLQAQWSFGKTGGIFSKDPFTQSGDTLWSISSYEALPLWIRAQHLSE